MTAILEMAGLEAGYGHSQVLFGLDLKVGAGETASLLGRNGMGKTTTVRAIMGLTPPSAGSITFMGERIDGLPPDRIARMGLALVPEGRQIGTLGGRLSGGEQQMLAIGRALMTNPRLLVLDEATEGLAPLVRDGIWQCLAALRAAGQTTLVIDKYVERLIALCDGHTIIEKGRVVWDGTSAELDADHSVWHRYLGI